MKRFHSLLVVIVAAAALQLAGCAKAPEASAPEAPAQVEHLNGAQPTRVVLTEDAAKRIDVLTDAVQIEAVSGVQQTVIPYSSIVYDTDGRTWIYVSTDPLTYVRTPVQVESIQGDDAIIAAGLPSGTEVVSQGAEELFGSETEFEEE